MGTKLENATKQQIVEVLKKACILADIDAPTDINMLVEYMHDKFRATLDEVSEGIDLWITIESRIVKPRRLNIKFLGEVINLYRTQKRLTTKEKHNDYKRYEPKRSAKEEEAMWVKSYKYAWNDFYKSIHETETKIMIKQLEVLHDWLADKVSLRYTDEQIQDEVEWLKGYHKRYFENLHKDETNPFKKISQQYNEPKDLRKAAIVSIHFRLRIAKGERPTL
jgi:hypothetical protein